MRPPIQLWKTSVIKENHTPDAESEIEETSSLSTNIELIEKMDDQEGNINHMGIKEPKNSDKEFDVQPAQSQNTDGHSTPSGTTTQDDKSHADESSAAAMAQEEREREVDRLTDQLDYWGDVLLPFVFYMDQVDPAEMRRADPELVRKHHEKLDRVLEVMARLRTAVLGRPVLEDQGQR